jgi:GntR family transcriptional regulator, transcriptional repressor for pyruvate dehydrogenase complex
MIAGAVTKDHLAHKVVKELLARIAQGGYPRGQRLPPERQMAEELGVSRATLRQALELLKGLGVIAAFQGSGNFVTEARDLKLPPELRGIVPAFDARSLLEIIVARRAVEGETAALAARRRSREELARLAACLKAMRASLENLPAFLAADMAFHHALAVASRNRVLVLLMETIAEQQRFSALFTSYGESEQELAVGFHERILEAVRGRDEDAARERMTLHLNDMARYASDSNREE